MGRALTYNLSENFIVNLSDFILGNFPNSGNDFSRIACVFGGKRPNLFLRRQLAQTLGEPFYPPTVFSMDEFIEYIVSGGKPIKKIGELDACYLIYRLAENICPDILRGRRRFCEFFPWAQEIISFIEQLDLQDIKEKPLGFIQKSADIGYDVPDNINSLLGHIIKLRNTYHRQLEKEEKFCRGLLYLHACEAVSGLSFSEFDAIIFCGFFYLHTTESAIIKEIYKSEKCICLFQGGQEEWPVLKDNAKRLGIILKPQKELSHEPKINLLTGFDLHSQVCLVRESLKKVEDQNNTVIVVPQPETVVPLLFEVSSLAQNFNVSMGYPLKGSPLYTLFKAISKAEENKKEDNYYTRDYLEVLRHPLVKNLRFLEDSAVTRVLLHKVEEILTGKIKTDLGGSLFISLEAIEQSNDIYYFTRDTLRNMNIKVSVDELSAIFTELHSLFFSSWAGVRNFFGFSQVVSRVIDKLLNNSTITAFTFNLKVIDRILAIKDELETLSFSKESFGLEEIWDIFLRKLDKELVSFVGSPLKGLQILGLFETRSLAFDNVIIFDVNESILPKLTITEPLIPREVMLSLGLNRLEKEEEIQRYQFMSLISRSKNAYIIYEENQVKEKSRFIEELIWKKQKDLGKLELAPIPKAAFHLVLRRKEPYAVKTFQMLETFKKDRYSASRINTYLECPLQFYYKYALGLREADDLLDEPQARDVGDFIHELLEETFKRFLGKRPAIDKDFKDYFWKVFEKKFSLGIAKRMKSDSLLLEGIIKDRLKKFLSQEQEYDEVENILCLEEEFIDEVEFCATPIKFVIKVDRIDELVDKSLNIIDYKTGKIDRVPKRLQKLTTIGFSRESIRENIKSFQLPLYYYFVQKRFPDKAVNAQLYSIRTLERKSFISEADYPEKEKVIEICLKALGFIFKEIFDPTIPFTADKEENKCRNCEFRLMCS